MTAGGAGEIAVLDYGIGNLGSAYKALLHLGAPARLVHEAAEVDGAAGVVLPGVGAFGACAAALERTGLADAARRAVDAGTPFLGICVGFQLLYEGSDEDPAAEGLAILPGVVRRLSGTVKHPQMQWNVLDRIGTGHGLLADVPAPAWVYFVHSYAPEVTPDTTSTCDYGGAVTASAERPRLWGTQFHPEKSGPVGLHILTNFVRSVDAPEPVPGRG